MDREHILRIVLEGRNKFSNVLRDMARQSDVEFRRIRNSWKSADTEAQRYARTLREANQTMRATSGFLGALRQRADAAGGSLRRLRQETASYIRESRQRGTIGDIVGGFTEGRRMAAETRKAIQEELALSREMFEAKKKQFEEEERLARQSLERRIEEERDQTTKLIQDLQDKKIAQERRTQDKISTLVTQAAKRRHADALRDFKRQKDAEITETRRASRIRIEEMKREHRDMILAQKQSLRAPDEQGIIGGILEQRRLMRGLNNDTKNFSITAGVAWGDFHRGLRDGRAGLRALTVEGRRADTVFARLGNTIGRATRSIGTIVQLRWFIVISALQLFGSLIATVGANLISLASSAALAAGALGGAFAAALAQGTAVMGLFAAAASRLSKVMDALKLSEQNRLNASEDAITRADAQRDATQRLADAQWNLMQALEGVTDAQRGVKEAEDARLDALRRQRQAVRDLSEARIEAAQSIVDANLEERDAALSLEEAELAVLEAKQRLREETTKSAVDKTDIADAQAAVREAQERLRIAREEGDQVEIQAAVSQLTNAQQNLSKLRDQIDASETDLKQAQLAVERAELNREQAAIRNRRAADEAAEARRKGVEGADEVVAARQQLAEATEAVADAEHQIVLSNRGVRDALHAVAVARREEADARRGQAEAANEQTAAQKNLQKQLADMSEAERGLFRSLRNFQRIWKEQMRPITDIIISAYARATDRAAELIQDPKILGAVRRLARALANAIDTISKFSLSPEFRNALSRFIDEAAKNVPLLTRAFLALLRVFLRLATAGAPLFRDLLTRFVGMVERLERATRDPNRLDKFFGGARRHLDAWIELGKAIGGVTAALIPEAAGAAINEPAKGPVAPGRKEVPLGPGAQAQGLLPFFTEKLRDAERFFEDNPESVTKFFNNMSEALQNLAPLLGRTLALLFEAFTSDDAAAFTRVILEVVIPGLTLFLKTLGLVSRVIVGILDIPIVGDIAKWALAFLVAEKALNRVFPVTQKLTDALKLLTRTIGVSLFRAVKSMSLRPLISLFDGARLRAMYFKDSLISAMKATKDLADRAYVASRTALLRLGDSLKNGAARALELSKNALIAAKEGLVALTQSARTAAAAVGSRLMAALRTAATFIRVQLVAALRFLRLNIRLLLLSTGIGALILAGVLLIENWDKVKKAARILADFMVKQFKRFVDWIRDNWKKVVAIILAVFLFPAGTIAVAVYKFRDKIIGVFRSIVDAVKGLFKKMIEWIKDQILGIGRTIVNKAKGVVSAIKGVFGGNDIESEVKDEANDKANKILEHKYFDKIRPRIKRMRAKGMTGLEILEALQEEGFVSEGRIKTIAKQSLAVGGTVDGPAGAAVPIIAHAGEWVLNKMQQSKLLSRLGMAADEAKAWLFGSPMSNAKKPKPSPGGRVGESFRGNSFNLTEQIDPDGVPVWFIEYDDGFWGNISARAAKRIIRTKGEWLPPHIRRGEKFHGRASFPLPAQIGRGLAMGGVVQKFAMGGVVAPQVMSGAAITVRPGQTGTHIGVGKQEFNVRAEGTMDWNYIMRLGAMRAQEV